MFSDFRQKIQKLTYLEFEGPDGFGTAADMDISAEDVLADLGAAPKPDLFLGRYTVEEIRDKLERHGVMEGLRAKGFPEVKVEIVTNDVYNHRLYVYYDVRDYDHILIELRLRDGVFRPKEQFLEGHEFGPMPMILVDWMMLQNPKKEFDPNRPRLPEQRYPGLGLLKNFIPPVMEVVKESGRKGVLDVPEHFHGAYFYSKWFRFFSPEMAGRFKAMKRDLLGDPLDKVSVAFDLNSVINTKTGVHEKWVPGEQILPLRRDVRDYFDHPEYEEIRRRVAGENAYELDREKYERKKKEMDFLLSQESREKAGLVNREGAE